MIAACELVQQAACLALLIPGLCVISLSLKGERDCWWQQPLSTEWFSRSRNQPKSGSEVLSADLATRVYRAVRRVTFEIFCAVVARVVIHDLDFWNLWKQEVGKVAFCSFCFSIASESRLLTLIFVNMSM